MKKSLMILGILSLGLAQAQQYDGRVGINTDTPSATLNVKSKTGTGRNTANLILEDAGGERLLTVLDSRSVGIGVVDPSDDELNINNRIRFSYNTRAWGVGIAAHTNAWARGYNFTSIDGATKFGGFAAYGNNNNVRYFYIGDGYANPIASFELSNRSVGIDISTQLPTQKLDINGNARLRELPNVAGANTDKVVVVDNTGVLKTVERSALGGSATQVGTGENNMPCNEANRGKMNFKKAEEDGKSDIFGICLKNDDGKYYWAYLVGGNHSYNGTGAFGSGIQ